MAKKEIKTIEFEYSCNLCGGKNSNCESCCGAEPKTISLHDHRLRGFHEPNYEKKFYWICSCGKSFKTINDFNKHQKEMLNKQLKEQDISVEVV